MTVSAEIKEQIVNKRFAGEGITEIAASLNVSPSLVYRLLKKAGLKGQLGYRPVVDGFQIKQISSKDGDAWVKQTRAVSDEAYETPEGHIVKGESALVDPDGHVMMKWVKTSVGPASGLTLDGLKEAFSDIPRVPTIVAPTDTDPNRRSNYLTADLHVGMLAWGKDSGRPWDLALAERSIVDTHAELVSTTPPTHTALMLDLGDQFHMNDQTDATPGHHHRLDTDGRFPKVALAACRIRRSMIAMALTRHEKVIYRGVRGNHDPEAQMWLSIALSMAYENNPRVDIDIDPGDFFFHEFGKTAIFANHGHKIKPEELPGILATDHPEAWARCPHRYCYSGHIHKERSGEKLKTRWETLRTITPGDNHAFTSGYRSGRELTSITYSAETGQRHRQFIPLV